MPTFDVITIGSATRDVYLFSKKFHVIKDRRMPTGQAESFAFGTKIELDRVLLEVGGGATNTAFTLARQGFRVGSVVRVGRDQAGTEIVDFLKRHHITPFVTVDPKRPTGFSVVFLTKSGERTILVYRGASDAMQSANVSWQALGKTKWVYMTSVSGNVPLMKRVVGFSRKRGIRVAVNFGKRELAFGFKRLLPVIQNADVTFLNREEASKLFSVRPSDTRALIAKLKTMRYGMFVVTEGKRGSMAFDQSRLFTVRVKQVKVKDTTGAGDAFGSGFLAGYMRTKNIRHALTFGSLNAAADVQAIGAKHGALGRVRAISSDPSIKITIEKIPGT